MMISTAIKNKNTLNFTKKLFIVFFIIQGSLFSQVNKLNSLVYIEIQNSDLVNYTYTLYLEKDSIEYIVSQSNKDKDIKEKISKKASSKILKKSIELIENIKIDSTKEMGLYSSHFIRITMYHNFQSKTVYIRDKYYYLLLENIFKTINKNVISSIRIPLTDITFSPSSSVELTKYNSFSVDWSYSFFDHPKNKEIYFSTKYKDSLRIRLGLDPDKKFSVRKNALDTLNILTLKCINDFKYMPTIIKKPTKYEVFEVDHHTKSIEITATFRSFDLANTNRFFVELKNYINQQILKETPMD